MSEPTHPLLQRYGDAQHCLRLLERSRRELLRFIGTLSEEALFTRRLPEQWSPAEELEHIALVEESGGKVIRMLRKVAGGRCPYPPRGRRGRFARMGGLSLRRRLSREGGFRARSCWRNYAPPGSGCSSKSPKARAFWKAPPPFSIPFLANLPLWVGCKPWCTASNTTSSRSRTG